MIPITMNTNDTKATTLRVSFLYRIFLDILILATLLAIASNFSIFVPEQVAGQQGSHISNVGYFCWDPTLSFPYLQSSVTLQMLYRISLDLPLLIIFIVELILFYRSQKSEHIHSGSSTIDFLMQLYQPTICFLFGYAGERLFKVVAKYFYPTLRPHFFAVCQPEPLNNDSCANDLHQNRYVTKFSCFFGGETDMEVKQGIYGSFPSGHASLVCYAMIFVTLYLQQRLIWRRSQLLKHVMQLLCLLMAWNVSVSRIRDHMQHPDAVVVGALLGALIAVCAAHFVAGGCSPSNALQEAKEKPVKAQLAELAGDGTELQWVLRDEKMQHVDKMHPHARP